MKDWVAWHAAYDDPRPALSARLRQVRSHLGRVAAAGPPGGRLFTFLGT